MSDVKKLKEGKDEFIEKWTPHVDSSSATIMYNSVDHDADRWGDYKETPPPDDVYNAIEQDGNTYKVDDLVSDLEDYGYDFGDDPPKDSDWSATIIEKIGDAGADIIETNSGNTYNDSWKGPWDINFRAVGIDGMDYVLYEVHQGGDVRGNYGPVFVYSGTVEDFIDALFEVGPYAQVTLKFTDGSEYTNHSTQSSDIWAFEYGEADGGLASEFLEEVEARFSEYNYEIEEMLFDLAEEAK